MNWIAYRRSFIRMIDTDEAKDVSTRLEDLFKRYKEIHPGEASKLKKRL